MPDPQHDALSDPAVSAAFERLKLELSAALDELEARRKKIKKNIVRAVALGVATGLILGVLSFLLLRGPLREAAESGSFLADIARMAPGFAAIAVAAQMLGVLNPRTSLQTYQALFRESIARPVAQDLGADFHYEPAHDGGASDFAASRLFRNAHRFDSSHAFSIRAPDAPVRFHHVQAGERSSSGTPTRPSFRTNFRGLFFVADLHSPVNGTVIVLPNTSVRLLDEPGEAVRKIWGLPIGESINTAPRQRLTLREHDPEFEQCFVVYAIESTGQEMASNADFLSLWVQRRLVEMRVLAGDTMRASFAGNHMMVAVPLGEPFLEAPVEGGTVSEEALRGWVAQVHRGLNIARIVARIAPGKP